ncbi:hypothetical protein N9L50_00125 [Flavobacteriaceae bacterium]|jgi:hypothetical protein|nr:hypothetical protein [Flavobacteriaceae bacterium]
MKKLLLIILLFCFYSCAVDDCVVITRKEKTGINFLFFFDEGINGNDDTVDEYGTIPSGAVTEEVFNQYEVGDTYCID